MLIHTATIVLDNKRWIATTHAILIETPELELKLFDSGWRFLYQTGHLANHYMMWHHRWKQAIPQKYFSYC